MQTCRIRGGRWFRTGFSLTNRAANFDTKIWAKYSSCALTELQAMWEMGWRAVRVSVRSSRAVTRRSGKISHKKHKGAQRELWTTGR